MTSQEKDLLSRFLQQLIATRAGQKDGQADAMIRDALAQQPDAAYLLVQRAMQLEQLLEATEAQTRKLQSELDAARSGSGSTSSARAGSFLSDPAWGSRPSAQSTDTAQAPGQQRSVSGMPIAARPAVPAAAAAAPARATGWGGGSMLGTVASTAAGVVAGSFLFQGIQGLMNKNDGAGAEHNAAAADHQSLADNSHTSGSLYEEPAAGDNLADADMDMGGDDGDFA